MRLKLTSGWRYAPKKEKPNKLHDGISHWRKLDERDLAQLFTPEELEKIGTDDLSNEYKETDRYMIRSIPQMLDKAEQTIVRESPVIPIIGVTGHRILTDFDKIEKGIKKALGQIEQSFQSKSLTIISSLALGADSLVVQNILKRPDAKLIVPLPLSQSDYETDFETEESKNEFRQLLSQASEVIVMPEKATRNEAYKAAGNYVLENCDVLIAIWDGQNAQGQGGTGEIVALARKRNLPIAWIHAGNRKPGTQEPTSLGDEQGKVTFENFS